MTIAAKVIQFPEGKQVVNTEADSGYIKLHRQLESERWAKCPVKRVIWEHLLLNATHKKYQTKLGAATVVLMPGQLISGRNKILKECFDQKLIVVTSDMVRGALNFFKKEDMLSVKSTRKGSIYTIVNWGKYQGEKEQKAPQAIPQQNPQAIPQAKPCSNRASSEALPNTKPNPIPQTVPTIQEVKTNKDTNVSYGSSIDETPPKKSSFDYPEEFEWIWKYKPQREGSNPKRKAFQACNARIKQGATWRELAEGMKRYSQFCLTKGFLNTDKTQQMATFFGPDEHFKEDWKLSSANQSNHLSSKQTARQEVSAAVMDIKDTNW
jgi:hypothetical protein